MHPADREMAEYTTTHESLLNFVKERGAVRMAPVATDELLALLPEKLEPFQWLDLTDGQLIDLGGRVVEVVHIPGHSLGHVAFIDHGAKAALTGDMCNPVLLLKWPESTTTLAGYRASILKLLEHETNFAVLGQGHGPLGWADKSILHDYIEATDLLLSGEAQGREYSDGVHQGLCFRWKKLRIFYDAERLQ